MREAYDLLATQYRDDESWHQLIWAATMASLDFQKYRKDLSIAIDLCERIDQVSQDLASLLKRVRKCNVVVPAFGAISVLLDEARIVEPELFSDGARDFAAPFWWRLSIRGGDGARLRIPLHR
jgi:hypothetical protein